MLALFGTRTEVTESEDVRSTPASWTETYGRRPQTKGNALEPQQIGFNRDGWKVEVRSDDGLMQITGRSPRNTRHLLVHIVEIRGAGVPGRAAVAVGERGQTYELVTAAD